jgi:hypothetical protein
MIPVDPGSKNAHVVACRLLEAALLSHRKRPWKPTELAVYVSLVVDAIPRGWGRIPKSTKIAERTGYAAGHVTKCLAGIKARGFLPYDHIIADQQVIEDNAAQHFERMTPENAKAAGYKPITYSYREEERHLLNSLLAGNFNQPVVIVEFERNGEPLLELWRHEDAIAKWTQKERSFDVRVRMGETAEL